MPVLTILFKLQIQISLHYCVFLLFVNVILALEGEFMSQNALYLTGDRPPPRLLATEPVQKESEGNPLVEKIWRNI